MIVRVPDPLLRQPSKTWEYSASEAVDLEAELREAMVEFGGVGISAVQIGKPICVCMVKDEMLINPRIVAKSGLKIKSKEGCLSVPGVVVEKRRHYSVTVNYTDVNGKEQERRFKDLESCIVQHEMDHFSGVLIG